MKVLIATPIHQVKDYSMERWLENVAKLQLEYPANLLLVDSSPGLDYIEKVKGYLARYGITNYKIEHLEINQEQPVGELIGRSREIIRQEILKRNYDAWFSWECDQLIPSGTLKKLVGIMKEMREGDFTMITFNSWAREIPSEPDNTTLGCSLITKKGLEKRGFLLEYPDMPDCWHPSETWFKKNILKDGGGYGEVYGVIKQINHVNIL